MASIEINCANQDCESSNVELTESVETRFGVFEHRFLCNRCKTEFAISTELIVVEKPKEKIQN